MANLHHPGHLNTSRRVATSYLHERILILGFGIDLSLIIFSITKAFWPIGTFKVTALQLAFVAFKFPFLLSIHVMQPVSVSCRAPQARRLEPAPVAHWEPQGTPDHSNRTRSLGEPVEREPGLTELSVSYDL